LAQPATLSILWLLDTLRPSRPEFRGDAVRTEPEKFQCRLAFDALAAPEKRDTQRSPEGLHRPKLSHDLEGMACRGHQSKPEIQVRRAQLEDLDCFP
jgi:hypothetical protein